jgi:4-amino-4-deoxy-L-arabinose transferase-like glycosyltransferase
VTQKPLALPARARELAAGLPWHRLALATILALSAFLGLFRLGAEGFSNTYYAATVKSMLTGWHNFFFASYDPGGFVSVDKPPLGFWVQAASAKLFGFHGWSLLLPQVVAGVLSVALLYHLVRRSFGPTAGLLAALVLAVTPITVATNRNNTVDGLLVLTLLLAAWAISRAGESGRLRWLLVGMALVGLGFNIKMLQAYLVLPAFYVVYMLGAPMRWRARLAHLALATLVLLGVSLSWAIAVDLTPPEKRPYVGGSSDNTVMDLIVGYNGINRLLGLDGAQAPAAGQKTQNLPGNATQAPGDERTQGGPSGSQQPQAAPGDQQQQGVPSGWPPQAPPAGQQPEMAPAGQPASPQGGQAPESPQGGRGAGSDGRSDGGNVAVGNVASIGGENGEPGPLRFFNEQLAGQIGWLLPLAGLGLLVAGGQTFAGPGAQAGPVRRLLEALRRGFLTASSPDVARRRQALALWGTWLLTQVVFFSIAGFWHTYYLVVVAPAIAALVGAGVPALGHDYRQHRQRGWLLPAALVGMAGLQATFLADYSGWSRWLTPVIVGLCVLAAGALVAARLWPRFRSAVRPGLATALGVLVLLIAPAAWSVVTVLNAPGEMLPRGGPSREEEAPGGASAINLLGSGGRADPKLVAYLLANRGGARFLVATGYSGSASPIILSTGEPVMALGGFGGGDKILTVDELAKLVSDGEVRFFLVASLEPPNQPSGGPSRPADGQQTAPLAGTKGPPQDELTGWVQANCEPVPSELWRTQTSEDRRISASGIDNTFVQGDGLGETLYDCGKKAR